MKKILSNVYMLAALFMIGAAITSCSKSDDTPAPEPKPVGPTTYTMTIKATKAADAKTRALSFGNDGALNATWNADEVVLVYQNGSQIGELTSAASADGSTTLTGNVSNVDEDVTLEFYLHGYNQSYTGQTGVLLKPAEGTDNSIETNYDYAYGSVNKEKFSISGSTVSVPGGVSFTSQQAIVKFTLMDVDTNEPISASSLKIFAKGLKTSSTTTGAITITPVSNPNEIYVALSGISDATVKLTATVGNKTYTYYRDNVTFTNGQYYTVNVKMFDPYSSPLTIEAAKAGTYVIYYSQDYSDLKYKKNDLGWITYDIYTGGITLNKGDKVCFKGNNVTNTNSTRILCSDSCYVYGNIMSIVYDSFTENQNVIPQPELFYNLFNDDIEKDRSKNILSHPSKELVLPATELKEGCYKSMFLGCSKLKRAPELPASITLPVAAYEAMFSECTSLNYVKCLAIGFGTNSIKDWLDGAATGTFVKANNVTWPTGGSGIPSDWNVIEE